MKRILLIVVILMITSVAFAGKKAKFYDFSDQLIDGKLKKPTTLYMESRTRAKFSRLLSLKKSFRQELMSSGKDPALGR